VRHGEQLIAFTEAVMGDDDAALATAMGALRRVLSPEELVEVAAVIGAFNVVDRIADATGIPLDPMMVAMSAELPDELDLKRFGSAASTFGG
jgi:hypothetical protein